MPDKNTFALKHAGPHLFKIICHTTDGRRVEVGSFYQKRDANEALKAHKLAEDARVADIDAILKRMKGESPCPSSVGMTYPKTLETPLDVALRDVLSASEPDVLKWAENCNIETVTMSWYQKKTPGQSYIRKMVLDALKRDKLYDNNLS